MSSVNNESFGQRNNKYSVLIRHWWLPTIGIISFLISFLYPSVGLLFGLFLAILSIGIFVEITKPFFCRLLNINPNRVLNPFWFIAPCGLILFFISFACIRFDVLEEKEKAAQEARQERLERTANTKVRNLVYEAKVLWCNGKADEAMQKIHTAENLSHATDFEAIQKFRTRRSNERYNMQLKNAVDATISGHHDKAIRIIEKALSMPDVIDLNRAKMLKKQVLLLKEPKKLKQALLDLPDKKFISFKKNKTIPEGFISGFTSVDKSIINLAYSFIDIVSSIRKEQKSQEAAKDFIGSIVGKKASSCREEIKESVEILNEPSDQCRLAYVSSLDVSFVSNKDTDRVIFADYGKNTARQFVAAFNQKLNNLSSVRNQHNQKRKDPEPFEKEKAQLHSKFKIKMKEMKNKYKQYANSQGIAIPLEEYSNTSEITLQGTNIYLVEKRVNDQVVLKKESSKDQDVTLIGKEEFDKNYKFIEKNNILSLISKQKEKLSEWHIEQLNIIYQARSKITNKQMQKRHDKFMRKVYYELNDLLDNLNLSEKSIFQKMKAKYGLSKEECWRILASGIDNDWSKP